MRAKFLATRRSLPDQAGVPQRASCGACSVPACLRLRITARLFVADGRGGSGGRTIELLRSHVRPQRVG
jgi:hypothetical protein